VLEGKKYSKESDKGKKASMPVDAFVEQAKVIVKKLIPTAYTTLITLLVSKKILDSEDFIDFSEETEEYVAEMYKNTVPYDKVTEE
jgi:hypothetical protein